MGSPSRCLRTRLLLVLETDPVLSRPSLPLRCVSPTSASPDAPSRFLSGDSSLTNTKHHVNPLVTKKPGSIIATCFRRDKTKKSFCCCHNAVVAQRRGSPLGLVEVGRATLEYRMLRVQLSTNSRE